MNNICNRIIITVTDSNRYYSPQPLVTVLLLLRPDSGEPEENAESDCSDHDCSEERERLSVGRPRENFIQNIQGYAELR